MTSRSNILVTGATGVVGRLLIPELVRAGYRVTALGRSDEKRRLLERWGATAVHFDIFDRVQAQRVMAGQETVINLATHMPSSAFKMMLPWAWRENDRVRRDASAALVDAAIAAGVSRFIQESFAPIYADAGTRWVDETSPVRPASYNTTVLDAERSAQRFTAAGGVGVVLRFASFYGPDPMLEAMVDIVRRGWSPIPGAAAAYWSSISHEDAASAAKAALKVPAGIYNVCDDEPLTRRDWADTFAAAVGAPPPRLMPSSLAALGGSAMRLLSRSQRMSNRRFKSAAAWTPKWSSVRTGLPAAVNELLGRPREGHRAAS
jgi:nucleoside-diphosphate-sugar epimerase